MSSGKTSPDHRITSYKETRPASQAPYEFGGHRFSQNGYNGLVAEYGYTTVFEPLPDGGYNVLVPAIPEDLHLR